MRTHAQPRGGPTQAGSGDAREQRERRGDVSEGGWGWGWGGLERVGLERRGAKGRGRAESAEWEHFG